MTDVAVNPPLGERTRSRKRKLESGPSSWNGQNVGRSVSTDDAAEDVIVIEDNSDGDQSKNAVEFVNDSINDSLLVGAMETIEEHQSSPFIRSNSSNYKKIHMDMLDCKELATSCAGAQALTRPSSIAKSSRDPNRGLYPRAPKKDLSLSGSFVPASALHEIHVSRSNVDVNNVLRPQTFRPTPTKQRSASKLPYQTNSLHRYFSNSQPTCPSTQSIGSTPPKTYSSSQGSSTPLLPKSPPTFMYSPIKQISGSNLYVVDTEGRSNSPTKSANAVQKDLFNKQKSQRMPKKTSKATKSKKSAPTFNRNNSFLYSNDPIPKPTTKPKDLYGLLGNGHLLPDDPEGNLSGKHINDFPYEILENILCRLPMMDLCLNVNRVCRLWRDIIADKRFVPWKKLYNKVKQRENASIELINRLMEENGMHSKETFLINLVRYMKNFKPVTAHNMIDCLKTHSMYITARALMDERLQDCFKNDVPNPWSVVTLLVILSEFVSDIQDVFTALLSPQSQCLASEVTECMYATATFLLAFRNVKYSDVWTGMHYRVFYALYLFENEFSTTASHLNSAHQHNRSGQQSIVKYSAGDCSMQMTHEQQRICNHNVGPGETIKIVAFAGTGKTTTLVRYTQLRPSLKFLLIVYNRSVKDHAASKFPVNVTCMTGHGLAYKNDGRRYAGAQKLGSNLRVTEVLDVMKATKGESLYVQAKLVITTIDNFMASADEFITTAHTPKYQNDEKAGTKKEVPHNMQMHYSEQAEKIWSVMIDLNDRRIKLPHDGYLKLYQLRKPKIYGYDALLIDEAQDITPAVADIIDRQSMPKIMVGDPHQQIYSFRGAINAMQGVKASHVFYLTQSFRFGPEIAHVASCCLEFLKNEKRKTIVGNSKPGSIRGEQKGQVAIIARSNFQLFVEAVKHCCFSDKDIKVGFVGGMDGFGFPMILDIYTLMLPPDERAKERREIQNYLIKKFHNLGDLEKYANKTMDNELLGKIKIVKTYNTAIPSHVNKIRSKSVKDNTAADILFTTAHKAKGLEFSTVRITDDFTALFPTDAVLGGNTDQKAQPGDENNLLYVAVTRAKKCLQMSPTVYRLLRNCGENFLYPVSSERLRNEGVTMKCAETERDFDPVACTIVRRKLRLGDNIEKEQLVYCPQWVTEDMTSLRQLFGSLKDERRDPESIGRLRVQEMDADMIPNYGPEGDDLEEYDMEYDLKQIHPYVAL